MPQEKDYWKLVTRVINESELVLIVLDARFPNQTRNPELERKIIKMKKDFIYIINKADLVDKTELEKKTRHIEPKVLVSSKKNLGTTILRNKIFHLIKKRPITISVVGYPNTGKSSLINCLKQKRSAGVSSRSGFTRGKQLLKITEGIYLIDTPGVIPSSTRSETLKALTNIKNPETIKDPDLVAMKIINQFMKNNPQKLEDFYQIRVQDTLETTLEAISKRLNHLKKGGKLDTDRTAKKIITDWQRGKLLLN